MTPASATGGRATSASWRHEQARHLRDPALAPEVLGERAGGRHGVQRVAGRPQVDETPDERRDRHQRGAPQPSRPVRGGPTPEPEQAGQDPALGAQQAGEDEQDRGAAPALRLARGRPHHEREEGHVDVGAHRVEQEREARSDEQRRQQRRPRAEDRQAEPPRPPRERDEAQERREHEQAVRVLPGEPDERGVGDVQRMLGRRRVGLERRLEPVEDLTAPDEVVVGVVVRIARDDQPPDDRRREERDAGDALGALHGSGAAAADGAASSAASPVPSASRAHVERILEEGRVEHRVHEQRSERGRHRDARGRELPGAPGTGEEPPERGDEQRQVGREPDDALLRRDGHRDRVRGVRRALVGDVLRASVLAAERAGAPPADRLLAEQPPAARDEVVAPARRVLHGLVRAEVQAQRARREQDDGHADHGHDAGRRQRAAQAPAERADDREPHEQRDERRLRERQHQPGPQHREHHGAGERDARPRRPRDHGGDPDHHDDEEAPVDVRVEEQRVDAEVGLERVGVDDPRVQQQVLRRVLPEPDADEREGQHHEHPERARRQAQRPAHAHEQREQDRERDVEEHDRLERPVGVAGVRRLDGVEHEHGRQRPLQEARAALPRVGIARRAQQVGHGAGRDDEVQREQQVRGLAADVERDPERQRRGGHERQQPRAPREQPAHRAHRGEPHDDEHRGETRVVAQRLHLVGGPDVTEQHGHGEHERAEHRRRPRERGADHQRRRRREARGHHAGGRGRPARARG